jgi:hypothetical protein
MSDKKTEQDVHLYDSRTVERRIRRGQLTRKDLERHLKALPDSTDKSETVVLSHPTKR